MSHSITVLELSGAGYPARLRGLRDAPARLHVCGALPEPEPQRIVAIVGARAASGRSLAAARALSAELAGQGFLVLSGGAIGIDAAAHRGALDAGGRTAAVLACGFDAPGGPGPARNHMLFDDILQRGGALVTPYLPGVPARRYHFIRRNRIVAGMADAVVVVEASMASGALYTAAAALEYGRVLGAMPGSPGAEALLAQGAAAVETAGDLLSALAGRPRRPSIALPDPGSDEASVLDALEALAPHGEAELTASTGLGARAVARALVGLEIEGLALLLPGRAYVRSPLAQALMAR